MTIGAADLEEEVKGLKQALVDQKQATEEAQASAHALHNKYIMHASLSLP